MSDLSLMIVGSNNKPTGGIPRYIPNQREHLPSTVDATVYDIGAPSGSGPLWFLHSMVLALLDAVRFPFQAPPDAVHVHTSHAFAFYRSSVYVLFARYVWRRPVVLHIHGSSFDEFVETDSPLLGSYQRLVFDASDRVIVLGDYWFEELSQHVDEESLEIIPNAVDPTKYDPRYDGSPPTIVFISDLVERKGVFEIVGAIDALADEPSFEFEVELGGKGELSDEFEGLADRHDNVTYHGYVSEQEKRRLLSEGQIYLLPSFAEGLPIAMLEAMAGGNAIISTTVGSIPEVITGDNGLLIEPGDAAALKEALRTALRDLDRTEQMARNNTDLVRSTYAWDQVMDQLVSCYDDVTETPGQ